MVFQMVGARSEHTPWCVAAMQVVGHRGETGSDKKSHVESCATHGGLGSAQDAETLEKTRNRTFKRRWSSDGKGVVAGTGRTPVQRKLHRKAWDLFFRTNQRHEMVNVEATPVYNERRVKLIHQNGSSKKRHTLGDHDRWSPIDSLSGHGHVGTKHSTEPRRLPLHIQGVEDQAGTTCSGNDPWSRNVLRKLRAPGSLRTSCSKGTHGQSWQRQGCTMNR